MIVSELHGKVMDIKGGSNSAGAEVIVWPRKHDKSPNQLWYTDEMGCVRSMLNDFAPECRGKGDKVKMHPYNGQPHQQWRIEGNKVVNRANPSECLDIERADTKDGAHVISYPYKKGSNQHWRIEYV